MRDNLQLNVSLLRRRVPNLTTMAKSVGLRAATVSNLCTGKTPIGKAEVGTLVTLAKLAGCSLDELIIQKDNIKLIETGIKVIDLFAPIVQGGIIGLVACPGSGQMALAAELCYRMKINKFKTIFWKPVTEDWRLKGIVNQADTVCPTIEDVYKDIVSFHSNNELFLIADREVVIKGELMNLQKRLELLTSLSLTILLVDILGEAIGEDIPYGPMDTLLKFDINLSKRNIYPSVDPVYSISTMSEGSMLEPNHLNAQLRAKKVLRRYRELSVLVNLYGIEGLSETDEVTYNRGKRLEAYLSQPQYVVEEVTGKSGKWVKLNDTLGDIIRLLNGSYDHLSVNELSYNGSLSQGNSVNE
jgi:F-type H+-transporting ATPase subunit beta